MRISVGQLFLLVIKNVFLIKFFAHRTIRPFVWNAGKGVVFTGGRSRLRILNSALEVPHAKVCDFLRCVCVWGYLCFISILGLFAQW